MVVLLRLVIRDLAIFPKSQLNQHYVSRDIILRMSSDH